MGKKTINLLSFFAIASILLFSTISTGGVAFAGKGGNSEGLPPAWDFSDANVGDTIKLKTGKFNVDCSPLTSGTTTEVPCGKMRVKLNLNVQESDGITASGTGTLNLRWDAADFSPSSLATKKVGFFWDFADGTLTVSNLTVTDNAGNTYIIDITGDNITPQGKNKFSIDLSIEITDFTNNQVVCGTNTSNGLYLPDEFADF